MLVQSLNDPRYETDITVQVQRLALDNATPLRVAVFALAI